LRDYRGSLSPALLANIVERVRTEEHALAVNTKMSRRCSSSRNFQGIRHSIVRRFEGPNTSELSTRALRALFARVEFLHANVRNVEGDTMQCEQVDKQILLYTQPGRNAADVVKVWHGSR